MHRSPGERRSAHRSRGVEQHVQNVLLRAFYDPRPAIDTLFVDDRTAVVYFQFEPNGKYHGMSYYLTSGDGCGFCYDGSVKSTVKIAP